ncbi:MAG TPA: acetyl-CoA carboxylase carboxyltransferase subunit, partial [Mycobacterium sp.]
ERLRQAEVDASFRSAGHLGFDDLIHPQETRDALLDALERGIYSRQAAAEPVCRTAITP